MRVLTQERLAERADLNPRMFPEIKAGDITVLVTTLACLREALGCDWKRLLGRAGSARRVSRRNLPHA